ncbi:unnamed protein product, partial [Ambrosiozyma monospora]
MQPTLLSKSFQLDNPRRDTLHSVTSLQSEGTELSRASSGHSSIYIHSHCKNPKPLNVLGAHIVQDAEAYTNEEVPETKDIELPKHTNLINELAIDIGGSLAKLVYFTRNEPSSDGSPGGGRLNFFKIETSKIDEFIGIIKQVLEKHYGHNGKDKINHQLMLLATGGGSHKFHNILQEQLNCVVQTEDEITCLV